jgi:hypothetical protein
MPIGAGGALAFVEEEHRHGALAQLAPASVSDRD